MKENRATLIGSKHVDVFFVVTISTVTFRRMEPGRIFSVIGCGFQILSGLLHIVRDIYESRNGTKRSTNRS